MRKTGSNATLSTTNPTLTALGANLGLCGEKPVTNHLHHGMAMVNGTRNIKITDTGTRRNQE
jgi:hypothetical protein